MAAPCVTCGGRGIVEVPETEGRGAGLLRLCPSCHASGGVRVPMSVPTRTEWNTAVDVTGSGEARKSGAPGASVDFGRPAAVSKSAAAFAKAVERKNSAYSELRKLAEREREISGGRLSPEAALSKILRTPEGKALYRSFDEAGFDAARHF